MGKYVLAVERILEGWTWETIRDKQKQAQKELRRLLEEEFETDSHPKAGLLWELAWDYGHHDGTAQVEACYRDFVGLLS